MRMRTGIRYGKRVTIAEALESERKRQKLSLSELARRSKLSVGRVGDVLGGTTKNPGVLTIIKLTDGLLKSLGWLESKTREQN